MATDLMATDLMAANQRLLERRQQLGIRPIATPAPASISVARTNAAVRLLQPVPPRSLRAECCGLCGVVQPPGGPAEIVEPAWVERRVKACEPCAGAWQWWTTVAGGIEKRLRTAGCSLVHSRATPSDFSAPLVAEAQRLWDDCESLGLFVGGGTGTGKTHFAAMAMRLWLGVGGDALQVLARQLFRRIWSTYGDGATESEERVLGRFCDVGLLVIDDLGREGRASPAVLSALHEVLSVRIDNLRPTVVTTNLSLVEIGAVYGEAIQSRLGALRWVLIDGQDRRNG